jgi:hypothetical protein
MPVINLGFLGKFKLQRLEDDEEPTTPLTREQQADSIIIELSPPPYWAISETSPNIPTPYTHTPTSSIPSSSASSTHAPVSPASATCGPPTREPVQDIEPEKSKCEIQWISPVSAQKPMCRVIRFRRYLVEIIALNLGADFCVLNAILYPGDKTTGTNSILSPSERTELLAISRLVQQMHGNVRRGEASNIQDQKRIYRTIMDPYYEITYISPTYLVLDLLGWYSGPLAFPALWSERVPGFTSRDGVIYNEGLEWLETVKNLIREIVKSEGVAAVLESTLSTCGRRCGYGEIEPTYEFHTGRDDYRRLCCVLHGGYELYTKSRCSGLYKENEIGCVCGCRCECACRILGNKQGSA